MSSIKESKRKLTRGVVISWASVVVMACIIFWFSSKSGETLDSGLGFISAFKAWLASIGAFIFGHTVDISPVGHFTEYLVFGILLLNALRHHIDLKKAAIAAVCAASAYGITDEIHQIFVPQRSCDPLDWAVDTIAALLGALIVYAVLKARNTTSR